MGEVAGADVVGWHVPRRSVGESQLEAAIGRWADDGAEMAVVAEGLAGPLIEIGDGASSARGEQDRLVVGVGGIPVADHALAELVGVVAGDDAAVVDEVLYDFGCTTESDVGDCLTFDGVELTAVISEFVVAESFGEGLEESAGVDLGELFRVADEDELGVGYWRLRR